MERLKWLEEMASRGFITEAEEAERVELKWRIQSREREKMTDSRTDGGGKQATARGEEHRRLTFREAIEMAEDQINLREYAREHECYKLMHDMCRAMAEIYMMPPAAHVKIGGEELEASMVAEVLHEVTEDMAVQLCEEIRESMANVVCIKAYLRGALYNKVFEFEAAEVRLDEQVKRDFAMR